MSNGPTVHVSSGQISGGPQPIDTLIVDAGGWYFDYGPIASGIDNGLVTVEENARVSNITVGGTLNITYGSAQAITVTSGGQVIDQGLGTSPTAAVQDVTVQSGGTLFADANAAASGVTVLTGGTVSVGAGGSVSAVTLSGGRLELANSGTVVSSGGTELVGAGATCVAPMGSVLVPAGGLVGCAGIAVEHGRDRVDYVHLELARHDVILAEGAAAELFLDDDSRAIFQRCDGIPGNGAAWCARRVTEGYDLELIRETLQVEYDRTMTEAGAGAAPLRTSN